MNTCEQVRAQLLGYLYDLLDDGEKLAVEAHLAGCEDCHKALSAARRQQRLIATAAKSAFPNVQFERPKSSPVESTEIPRPKQAFLGRHFLALAASFLVAAGLAVPAGWFSWTASGLRARQLHEEAALTIAQDAQAALVQARAAERQKIETALAGTRKETTDLEAAQPAKWAALYKSVADRQLQLSVVGPEVLQAGAENDYTVQTRNLQNEALTAQLSARVVDQKGNVFFEMKDVPTLGAYRLRLPADLPATPDKQLSLDLIARKDGQPERTLHQKISLAAPIYLTHLATDKPMYRPGETVHYRSLTLERFSLKPVQEPLRLQFMITGPQGDEVFKQVGASRLRKPDGSQLNMPDGKPVAGIGAGEYLLPAGMVGGEYTLSVRELNNRFPQQERKFIVNNFANPRLNKELDFTRKSYGPGQEVVAACSATRAEGGPVANRPVIASVFIDGKPYGQDGKVGDKPFHLQTDALGKVSVRFKLPDNIDRGQASLTVKFDDGGSVESLVRTIPIALEKLMVEFFPEGGDLVAGASNRVYFQARTTLGKPAELKGHIVDDQGKTVTDAVATLHDDLKPGVNQGMGRFAFTPVFGRSYQLKIDEPAGMKGSYTLPEVRKDGVVLQVGQPGKETLPVQLTSVDKDRNLLIGVYCRGRLLDHQTLSAKKGQMTPVEMKPALPAGGVFRVTVFEELPAGTASRLAPRAERLVYRAPANALTLAAKFNQERFIPGERVKIGISAANAKNEPTPAVAMAAVVDKSVLTLADEKTFHGMPTHFYLSTEIRRPEDLEYADFLVSNDAKAPAALDLLLGTQGWRRFAEQNPERFRQTNKEDADRLLLTMGQAAPVELDMVKQDAERLRDAYVSRLGELTSEHKQLEKSLSDLQNPNGSIQANIRAANASIAAARSSARAAELEYSAHWESLRKLGVALLPVFLIVALVLLVSCLVVGRVFDWKRRGLYAFAAGVASFALLMANLDQILSPGSPENAVVRQTFGEVGSAAPAPVDARLPAPAAMPMEPEAPQRRFRAEAKEATDKFADRNLRDDGLAAPAGAVNFDRNKQAPGGFGGGIGGFGGLPGGVGGAGFGGGGFTGGGGANRNAPAAGMPAQDRLRILRGPPLNQRPPNQPVAPEALKKSAADAEPPSHATRAMSAVPPPAMPPAPAAATKDLKVDNASRKNDAGLGTQAGGFGRGAQNKGLGRPLAENAQEKTPPATEPKKKERAIGLNAPAAAKPADQNVRAEDERRQPQAGGRPGAGAPAMGGFGGRRGAGTGIPAQDAAPKGQQKADVLPEIGGIIITQNGNPKGIAQQLTLLARELPAQLPEPMLVREYAHVRPSNLATDERKDFVDTVYWHPALVLPNGTVDLDFQLGDAVTSYQLLVFAHTADGSLGSLTKTFEVRLPFTLEPKLPIEVTAGDRIDLPVSTANNTTQPRTVHMNLEASNMKLYNGVNSSGTATLDLAGDSRGRAVFSMQPKLVQGESAIVLDGTSEPFRDRIVRRVSIVPQGFPVVQAKSDLLEGTARQAIDLPESWIPGTLECQVQVYPSTLAALEQGLEGLLREPYGCFEQTSSTNYPNLLVLDYLRESNQVNPALEKRARELLANGYAKLTSFECYENSPTKRRGYEWFGGQAAPHEALTAYGLLEFRDMARVFDVDKGMLDRTQKYLMSRKDGKGGFLRNAHAVDQFGRAPDDLTNAYIVWSLTESSQTDDVTKELAALAARAKTSEDPYFLALVAISLLNRAQADDGIAILKSLIGSQKEDGHLDGQRTSITGSGGRDLQIETTALVVLGWLKANRPALFNDATQKAIRWIGRQRGGYGAFGSTQSTILALKALIAFTRNNKRSAEAGELKLEIGGRVAAALAFPANAQDALTLGVPNLEKQFHAGRNDVQISITGRNQFPYTLTCRYQVGSPPTEPSCVVRLETKLDRTTAAEGEAVHLNVQLENIEDHGQSMTVAIVGLPAGLTLPEDMKQLKDHCRLREDGAKPGLISAWEIRGRELILYWRELAPKQKIEVPIDLIARVPGEYTGPASRSYLYYNSDRKNWIKPLHVKVTARQP